jgi:hypothetical protein
MPPSSVSSKRERNDVPFRHFHPPPRATLGEEGKDFSV